EVGGLGAAGGPEPGVGVLARLGALRPAARAPTGGGIGAVDRDGLPAAGEVAAQEAVRGGHRPSPAGPTRSGVAQQREPSSPTNSTAQGQRARTSSGSMPSSHR